MINNLQSLLNLHPVNDGSGFTAFKTFDRQKNKQTQQKISGQQSWFYSSFTKNSNIY